MQQSAAMRLTSRPTEGALRHGTPDQQRFPPLAGQGQRRSDRRLILRHAGREGLDGDSDDTAMMYRFQDGCHRNNGKEMRFDRLAVGPTLSFQEEPMRKWFIITALACSVVGSSSNLMAQNSKAVQNGSIEFTGGAAALGVGYTWGSGVHHYKGEDYPFTASGLTLLDIGGTENQVSAEVYRLNAVEDFPGAYSSAEAGATLVGGGGIGY